MMNRGGKSDSAIVAERPTNKAGRPAQRSWRAETEGECGTAKHAPGSELGKRVSGAGSHTTSSKTEKEGKVHRAPAPHQPGTPQGGVLRAQGECRTWSGWVDVASLRGRPGCQDPGPTLTAHKGAYRALSVPARLHTKTGRSATPTRDCRP